MFFKDLRTLLSHNVKEVEELVEGHPDSLDQDSFNSESRSQTDLDFLNFSM